MTIESTHSFSGIIDFTGKRYDNNANDRFVFIR